jgi:ABC transporter substrate binding protein
VIRNESRVCNDESCCLINPVCSGVYSCDHLRCAAGQEGVPDRISNECHRFRLVSPEVFRQGLRELGYIEGKNIVIEWRSGEGNLNRRGPLAAELVRLKLDLIVAVGPGDARSAREATATIPIVMIQGGDPVSNSQRC